MTIDAAEIVRLRKRLENDTAEDDGSSYSVENRKVIALLDELEKAREHWREVQTTYFALLKATNCKDGGELQAKATARDFPQPSKSDEELWRDLCEKDDRTSPAEYPDMALIDFDELAAIRAEATIAERERCAKQLDFRAEELTKRANAHFEEGDQGSAIIERTSAQEARVNAAAIRKGE